jgi:hypothetical protein
MSDNDSGEKEVPEFAKFLREMGVRALDRMAAKIHDRQKGESKPPKPVRKIADHWQTLTGEQRKEFVGQIISAAEALAAAAPAAVMAMRARRQQKAADVPKAKAKPAKKSSAKKSAAKKGGAKKSAAKKSSRKKASASTES